MLPPLISHSPDLLRLWEEGLVLEIKEGHLLVHEVPFMNSQREVESGTLVSTLNLAGEKTMRPETHVSHFIGGVPCDKVGQPLQAIINSTAKQSLGSRILVDVTFSSKPTDGYPDYYEKMMTYLNIISAPAKAVDPSATEKKFRVTPPSDDSPFHYTDSNSSRAGIGAVSDKLRGQKIAIIGLGGTGSYILDAIAKTPVKEILLYDGDWFLQHNAFRAPGAPTIGQLKERLKKVDYFAQLYSNMHKGIVKHGYVTSSNIHELSDMDFVFIAMDMPEQKKTIVDYLLDKKKPFIDVGIGVQSVDDTLIGILGVTTCTGGKSDHLSKGRISFGSNEKNEYVKNIQIAELNSMNAALAVIKWKKLLGFYQDLEKEHYSNYSINVNMLLSEDNA